MAQLQPGEAKMYYDQDRLDKAALEFQVVIDRFPKTAAAEEATFLQGVSHYKRSHQAGELRKAWERLSRDYPQSEWTRKPGSIRPCSRRARSVDGGDSGDG